jgi:hypothetical protein
VNRTIADVTSLFIKSLSLCLSVGGNVPKSEHLYQVYQKMLNNSRKKTNITRPAKQTVKTFQQRYKVQIDYKSQNNFLAATGTAPKKPNRQR